MFECILLLTFRSVCNNVVFVLPTDAKDFVFRLSSEDSEEASACFYDSDDSGDTGITSQQQGEMDLLGEILDTLSTHSSDQGKLSGAKSLDFFRSMDDIDYKTTVSLLVSLEHNHSPLYWNPALLKSTTCRPVTTE